MIRRIRISLLLFAGLLCVTAPAAAQQTPQTGDPANEEEAPVLPDISPREVEIRGNLEISFPSLERQPLIGFNPPPRVPEIPPGRLPYIETYKQSNADLPDSPLGRPAPPTTGSLGGPPPIIGELEASAGRYLSRRVRARVGVPLGDVVALSVDLDYDGAEGFEPSDELDDVQAPYDLIGGKLALKTTSPRVSVGGELDGFLRSYTLFGTPLFGLPALEPGLAPDRSGRGVGGSLWMRTGRRTGVDLLARVRLATTRYLTEFVDLAPAEPTEVETKEQRFEGLVTADIPFGSGSVLADAGGSLSGLNENSFSDADLDEINAGAGLRLDIGTGLSLMAAGRYIASSTAGIGRTSYISPDFRIDIYPVSGLSLFFENRPEIQSNRMADLYGANPYLVDMPSLQATLFPINAGGGLTVFLGPVKVSARAGYRESPNFLFYEEETDQGVSTGTFSAQYGDVRILHGGGDVAVVLPGGFHSVVGLTVREGELTDTEGDIPYFSPITARAMVAYAFAQRRGLVELTGSLQGRRFVTQDPEPGDVDEINPYFDLDLDFSFNVRPSLGLLLRLENLIPDYLEQWQHYPEPPLTITAGMRVLW